MTSTTPRPARNRTRTTFAITAGIIAAIVIAFFAFSSFYADILWFSHLGFLNVLTTRWIATGVMFLIGFFAMAIPVFVSIQIAYRARPVYAKLNSQLDRYQQVIEPLRRLAMVGIPIVLGLFTGISAAGRWPTVLEWLNRTSFGIVDPQFGLDVSFFNYELPFYRGIVGYASAVVLLAAITAIATNYLYGGIRVSGREVRITRSARIQLAVTGAIYVGLQAVSLWLDQYLTVTDSTGLITGATYADVNARIPALAILAISAGIVAIFFLVTAVISRWRLPLIGTALLIVASFIGGSAYPGIVQNFQVNPSQQSLETPFIRENIDATRQAYGVADVEKVPYEVTTDAERGALREDAQTTANIRIIDPALISPTFRQLEQVRQYFQFSPTLNVDRYEIDGEIQDTVVAVRELNQEGQSERGWNNDVLLYTHGYGLVAAYGNQREIDGEPVFMQSGIPSTGVLGEFEPRVYFGENSPLYSIVGAAPGAPAIEIDPESPTSAEGTTTFDGDGGPLLDNVFKKIVYALKYQSTEILLSQQVTDHSQILYDRDPRERVQLVAPYLEIDSEAYPAVVDGRIVWIVDGYTTTNDYPYSESLSLSQAIADTNTAQPTLVFDNINYIRNSVKATVDAYDGSVTLYAWDDEDPLLQTWGKIFPGTLQSVDDMSEELLAHVRYPEDLFKVQREILETYHVTAPGQFFTGEDAWVTPDDPTEAGNARSQPPYYLTMQIPGWDEPAFTIYSTFIPRAAGESSRSVLTGYLAVNADPGEDYGRMTLLDITNQDTVPGPGQVQNSFDTDTDVANEVNILSIGNSEVVQGNLLTVPVGDGMLYVQPVYVTSTGTTAYPLLRKVLVAWGQELAFEDTLDLALDVVFGGDSGADAGDGDIPAEPGVPVDPDAEPGEDPAEEEPPAEQPTPIEGDLQEALADYLEALQDREAAYAANNLVAAAEADARMQDAIERAIAASE